jgi:hypothetical protein
MIPAIGAHDKLLCKILLQHALPCAAFSRQIAATELIFGQIDQFIDSRHAFDTA